MDEPERKRDAELRAAAPAVATPPPVRVFSQLGVRLPAELAGRLKAYSMRSGQSLNAIVARALDRYLSEEDSSRPVQ
jgi:predicted HicB family RNase H-like nuclease